MKTIYQIFKIMLFLLVAVVIAALVFWLVLSAGLPLWVAFFILLGLFGLVLCLTLVRRLILRWREQRFVQQVIEQDESYYKSLPEKEQGGMKDLQAKWKEAVAALKKSHLKQYGNPLYVLPWYVVLGESGSGKTTALQSARLSSPFVKVRRVSGISGTRNCDWWFLEKAVILDTAGRYAIPVDEGRDKDEWHKFLRLLIKFRKKEPINGLVITIAADKLASAEPVELEEDGRNIRRRMDELMRTLGAKFPIYVLITKCDLVQGMARFCDNLSEETLNQAMGVLNHDFSSDVQTITKNTIEQLTQRLRDLRLLVFHKSKPVTSDPGLLLFPEELERLYPSLETFMRVTFQENPYQETPFLRGIFFSSGRQEGTPYSHFLKELGLIHEGEVLEGTNKGFFLHDFFSRILPADRHLFTPTKGLMQWKRLTQNIGLTAWLAVSIAVCGLLSYSFAKNMMLMREVSQEVSKPVVLQNDITSNIIRLNQFRMTLIKFEKQNQGWWFPGFGLGESVRVEKALKDRYCKQFYDGFLAGYNKKIAAAIIEYKGNTASEKTGEFINQLVRCVNLLKGRQANEDPETLKAMPLPSYERTLKALGNGIAPEIGKKLTDMYLSYVIWNRDPKALQQETVQMQTLLAHFLELKNTNLNWIVALINHTSDLPSVKLEDFWGGRSDVPGEIKVEPAFTLKGMDTVQSFIRDMGNALTDPLIIANKKIAFQKWYQQEYFNAWRAFSSSFQNGAERLKGETEWQQTASVMGTDQDPYFRLLDRISRVMKPYSELDDLPSWLKCVYDFKKIDTGSAPLNNNGDKDPGIIQKAATKVESTFAKIGKQTGMNTSNLESKIVATQALQQYKSFILKMSSAASSQDTAFQMATAIYSDDPTTSKTPYFEARRSLDRLQTTMTAYKPDQKLFWNLVRGPVDFLLTFINRETACNLQNLWEKDVLMQVRGENNLNVLIRDLLGKGGYARKFIMGPAKPFIGYGLKRGFYPIFVGGKSIPFKDFFFTFLNKGSQSVRPANASYTVTIRGEPTSANKGATVMPYATEFDMQCSDKNYRLVNLNYPVQEKVKWSPQTCGDVVLQIKIANIVLSKQYSGDQAFGLFLKDFEKGSRTFLPSEFPNEEAALKRMKIKAITVQYHFEGNRPVLKLLESSPKRIPEVIATCWEH